MKLGGRKGGELNNWRLFARVRRRSWRTLHLFRISMSAMRPWACQCAEPSARSKSPASRSRVCTLLFSLTLLSQRGLLLCYILEPPASIVICTVKYADCDLIPYIPVQIRAVSVQDYPGNSCNTASPQLISLWMSGESWVIHQRGLPKLQCIIPLADLHLLYAFGMQKTWLGFSFLTACLVFIMGIRLRWLRCGACLSIERLAAECKWHICNHQAIIMQSEFQSSLSSGFFSLKTATSRRGEYKTRTRQESRNSARDVQLSLLARKSKAYRGANLHGAGCLWWGGHRIRWNAM